MAVFALFSSASALEISYQGLPCKLHLSFRLHDTCFLGSLMSPSALLRVAAFASNVQFSLAGTQDVTAPVISGYPSTINGESLTFVLAHHQRTTGVNVTYGGQPAQIGPLTVTDSKLGFACSVECR